MTTSVMQDYSNRLRDAQIVKEQTQELVNVREQNVKVLQVQLLDAKMGLETAIGQRNAAYDSVFSLKTAMQELLNAS